MSDKNVTPSTTETTDRLQEIRARLDAATPGTAGMHNFYAHAPADIAWLLAENEAFREQIGFLREHIAHVRGYAHHRPGCASIADADVIHDTPCDCGLDVEDD